MTRVGIYAGTFDPVHNGHIAFAEEALKSGLDRVVFLPERTPRGKSDITDFSHRVKMLQLATGGHSGLEVAELPQGQFTVAQTLPELRKRFGEDLTLLMGSDVAATLADWQDVDVLIKHMPLLIALRSDHVQADVEANLRRAGSGVRFVCIPSPAPLVSSRTIRQEPSNNYVHPAVRTYANKQRLY